MKNLLPIAHRGYSTLYPENTLSAFAGARDAGARMIECDVRWTKDGVPVIIHDKSIIRTSNGKGLVKKLTIDELRTFSFHNNMESFMGEPIPTVQEILALPWDIQWNLEIKAWDKDERVLLLALVDLIKELNAVERVIISCFNHELLLFLKNEASTIRRGLLYSSLWLNFPEELRMIQPHSIHPDVDALDEKHLSLANANGIAVYPWVVRDSETLQMMSAHPHVTGAMVDDCSLFDFMEEHHG